MNTENAKHTPGPWRWELSMCSKRLQLVGGKTRFDLTVLDFARWGMSSASMRLRDDVENMNIMHRCEKWAKPVPGREHHAEWFQDIDHPDARLIKASPTMFEALEKIRDILGPLSPNENADKLLECFELAKKAVAEAKGK